MKKSFATDMIDQIDAALAPLESFLNILASGDHNVESIDVASVGLTLMEKARQDLYDMKLIVGEEGRDLSDARIRLLSEIEPEGQIN